MEFRHKPANLSEFGPMPSMEKECEKLSRKNFDLFRDLDKLRLKVRDLLSTQEDLRELLRGRNSDMSEMWKKRDELEDREQEILTDLARMVK